jgi:hypothetical protein
MLSKVQDVHQLFIEEQGVVIINVLLGSTLRANLIFEALDALKA